MAGCRKKSAEQVVCAYCEKLFYPWNNQHKAICCSAACRRQYDEARCVVRRVLTVAEAAYLAGLIDGEGTLSVGKEKCKTNATGYRYTMRFSIAQANLPYLERIREMIGNGTVRVQDMRKQPSNHRPVYSLFFHRHQARWILPQVMPYLKLKGRHAEVVMAFLGSLADGREDRKTFQEKDVLRQPLYEESLILNHRGLPLP